MKIRTRTWDIVEVARRGDTASRAFDISILCLIFLNVVAVVIDSVESIRARWGASLDIFEAVSVFVFTVEYLARLWSCTVDSRYSRPIRGRLRFTLRAMLLVDLLAILPYYLPFVGIDPR